MSTGRTTYTRSRSIGSYFAEAHLTSISRALSAELGLLVQRFDPPLTENALFRPEKSSHLSPSDALKVLQHAKAAELPGAHEAYATCLTIRHHALLANLELLSIVIAAIRKVQVNASALRAAEQAGLPPI